MELVKLNVEKKKSLLLQNFRKGGVGESQILLEILPPLPRCKH